MSRLIPDEILSMVREEDPVLHARLLEVRGAIERGDRGSMGLLAGLPATVKTGTACRPAEVLYGKRRIVAVRFCDVEVVDGGPPSPGIAQVRFRVRSGGWVSRDGYRLLIGRVMETWPIEAASAVGRVPMVEADRRDVYVAGWQCGALGSGPDRAWSEYPSELLREPYLRGLAEGQAARAEALRAASRYCVSGMRGLDRTEERGTLDRGQTELVAGDQGVTDREGG